MIRISKTQNAVVTKYINDVSAKLVQVLMETGNDGNTLAAYNYGNGLISMNRAGSNYYYHYDDNPFTITSIDSDEFTRVNVIPEPATITLFALAAIPLLRKRRHKAE